MLADAEMKLCGIQAVPSYEWLPGRPDAGGLCVSWLLCFDAAGH